MQNAVGSQGKKHLYWAGGAKVMLVLTLGEAECYQAFHLEETACAKAHRP